MKPRIRPNPRVKGEWLCGGVRPFDEVIAMSPKAAYDLWAWYWRSVGVIA